MLGTSVNKFEHGCCMQYSVLYTVSFIIWKRDEICLLLNTWGVALLTEATVMKQNHLPSCSFKLRFYMQPPSSLTHIFHPFWTIIFLYLTFILPIKFSVSCLQKQVWTRRCGSQEANGKNYVLSCDTMWSSENQPSHSNMLPLLNMLLTCFGYGSGQIIFTLHVEKLSHTFLWLILHLGGFFALQEVVSKLCSVLLHTQLVHATFLIDMLTSVVR
jgi:hypothetical protein